MLCISIFFYIFAEKYHYMKKLYLILIMSVISTVCYCQSDFEIAQSFMSKKGVVLVNDAMNTRSNKQTYHIFSSVDGKGYAVVENKTVIAYSTEESPSKFAARPNMTRTFELTPKTPLEPLIEAKFNQETRPYRDSLPIIEASYGLWRLAPVGCGALALSKVLYYYKNKGCEALEEQYVGEKYPILEALPATTFNWDNILPEYNEGEYTEEQGIEVAKLMKYAGYAIETEYEAYQSGSWIRPNSLLKFGFSNESYSTADNEFKIGSHEWWMVFDNYKMTDLELEALLDRELEQGRPVLMAGYNKSATVGHWLVIDGRDDTGRYHIDDLGYLIMSQEMFMTNDVISADVLWWLNKVLCVVPIMPSDTTSINSVEATPNNNSVYNLQGQKVKTFGKGIYIVDGKKYLIKCSQ